MTESVKRGITIKAIKNTVVEILREVRGVPSLTVFDVKISELRMLENGDYEVKGTYTCEALTRVFRESGSFRIVLSKELAPKVVEVRAAEE